MELFIWSCSTGANHWIKTRSRVTCGFDLSLRLSDTHSPTPIPKTHPHTHKWKDDESRFAPGVFSSSTVVAPLVPEAPACCDGEAYRRGWR